jgi:hypothetical protein
MIWLGILIGFILGLPLGIWVKYSKKSVSEKYIRRGIMTNPYSSDGVSFDVQFELGELEATSIKSKVNVISAVASKSQFNDDSTKKKLSEMVDNTWIESDRIEWIENIAQKRNDKIDQILG